MNFVLYFVIESGVNEGDDFNYSSPNAATNATGLYTSPSTTNIMSPFYSTLQNYSNIGAGGLNTTKSVFSLKGAAFKNPISLTRTYFSLEDLSLITDEKLQVEHQRL